MPSPQKKLSINLLLITVPKKSIDYFASSYCPLTKSNDYTIKSLVVIFPYKKLSIIRYSLLFHIKSNDNFVNRYFSHTKYVS